MQQWASVSPVSICNWHSMGTAPGFHNRYWWHSNPTVGHLSVNSFYHWLKVHKVVSYRTYSSVDRFAGLDYYTLSSPMCITTHARAPEAIMNDEQFGTNWVFAQACCLPCILSYKPTLWSSLVAGNIFPDTDILNIITYLISSTLQALLYQNIHILFMNLMITFL